MVTVGSRLDWLEVVPNRADAHGAAEDGWAFSLFREINCVPCLRNYGCLRNRFLAHLPFGPANRPAGWHRDSSGWFGPTR